MRWGCKILRGTCGGMDRKMATIRVEPELYSRIEQAAQEQNTSAEVLLGEAVRQYLWELDRRKISEESAIYRRRHPELKARYLGQFIAMRNGEVVDHDITFDTLMRRVRQRFHSLPVMITQVAETSEQTLVRRGFRRETEN